MVHQEIFLKAEAFIRQFYLEQQLDIEECDQRVDEIHKSIIRTGTYSHTVEELAYGARVAWRNSNRCIGRLFWNSLTIIDARDVTNVREVKKALLHHIAHATNDGKIKATMTIFQPRQPGEKDPVRIYNHQLIRYAGYKLGDGAIIGDPHSVEFTMFCESLGWSGEKTKYDILPIVVQVNEEEPTYFDIPRSLVKEVNITHPDYPSIDQLGLKWYAVPIISEMKLEIGGLDYIAAPFNGWYMETEIGARDFADDERYNELPKVAEAIRGATGRKSTLWKDRALIELNYAVLQSFKDAGVSMVDHHTASNQFGLFEEKEKAEGREVTGDWTWLIPPISPATSHIFHKSYANEWKSPNLFYQNHFFTTITDRKKGGTCPFHSSNQ